MIYNFELEKQLLAGLLKEPESLAEISNFISNSDFYSKQSSLHSAIFRIIQQAIDAGDEIDEIILYYGQIPENLPYNLKCILVEKYEKEEKK